MEALNHALRGIPADRIRFHTCYWINMGPRVHDMELKDIVDLMLRSRAGAYSFEAANPRHEHEWRVWEDAGLPDDKFLIPGVVTHSSVLVEHPDTVAERLVRFAGAVGRERVIAGATAASRPSRSPTSSTRASCGPSSRRWGRAPAAPASSSGDYQDLLTRGVFVVWPPWRPGPSGAGCRR